MKNLLFSLLFIGSCTFVKSQELSNEIKSFENTVKDEVKAEENKGVQALLTQAISSIKSSSFVKGKSSADVITKLNSAKTPADYGNVLSSLAESINPALFASGWSKLKTGFNDKAGKIKSLSDVAGLASQLFTNLKTTALTSNTNKTDLVNTLSLIK
ncbi:MAG: hypothetical protein JST26_00070 [Bacteroidetes bacterium]|nr:hypothetical protein [Bacteroidota bacterium]